LSWTENFYKNRLFLRIFNLRKCVEIKTESEGKMKIVAKDLDFITAAQFRDEMLELKKMLRERLGGEMLKASL